MDASGDTTMESNEHEDTPGPAFQKFINPQLLTPAQNNTPESTTASQDEYEDERIQIRPAEPRRFYLPTGCCYDDRMKLHANADFSQSPHHPEDPRRIAAIFDHFKAAGLVFSGTERDLKKILKANPTQFMYRIPAREATQDEVLLVHEEKQWDWVMSLNQMTSSQLRELTSTFDEGRKSLYVGNLTTLAALVSAGSAVETCKSVVEGKVKNAIAIIRPPGHHAEAGESMGFCIFNNVPIAAAVCRQEYPETCRKVLILDWDVHHGNGIQNMFYKEPNVLYISIHVYQNGEFYPGHPEDPSVPDGGIDKCGAGDGIGYNINIGWADQGVGDGEYMSAFQRIIMPIAREFDPDLVIISAGFDAAAGDELGGCFVTPACYSHMTHMLMSLADGKVAVCLEGGYNLQAISRSALAVAKTLMGEPPEKMSIPPVNKDAMAVLENVRRIQSNWWDCMRPGVIPMLDIGFKDTQRLSEVIARSQKSLFMEKFDMTPLHVGVNGIQRVFENAVLCSPDIYQAKRVLVVLHDPAEILAQPHPTTSAISGTNAFISTPESPYIAWAIANKFSILDITIPNSVKTSPHDPYIPLPDEHTITNQSRDLLCFLWDNYLQLISDKCPIVIMGVGEAYLGIKQLLLARHCRDKISAIIAFIAGAIKPVRSEIDEGLDHWYGNTTQIYISPTHNVWTSETLVKKMRRPRFGNVIKGDMPSPDTDDEEDPLSSSLYPEPSTSISTPEVRGALRLSRIQSQSNTKQRDGEIETVTARMARYYQPQVEAFVLRKTGEWEEIYSGAGEGDGDETEEDEDMLGGGAVGGKVVNLKNGNSNASGNGNANGNLAWEKGERMPLPRVYSGNVETGGGGGGGGSGGGEKEKGRGLMGFYS